MVELVEECLQCLAAHVPAYHRKPPPPVRGEEARTTVVCGEEGGEAEEIYPHTHGETYININSFKAFTNTEKSCVYQCNNTKVTQVTQVTQVSYSSYLKIHTVNPAVAETMMTIPMALPTIVLGDISPYLGVYVDGRDE